jgi:hypothetical protein
MRIRIGFLLAVLALSALAGCDSKKSATAATVCTQFTAGDARSLLGVGLVTKVSYSDFYRAHTTESTNATTASQIAAVSAHTCTYETGDKMTSPFATYEYGFVTETLFSSVEKFYSAVKQEGEEEVAGVGQAAVFSPYSKDKTESLTVLLSGGRNFIVEVGGTRVPKAKLVAAAKTVAGRL